MKKSVLIVITALAVLLTLTATAERRIWMHSHSGNHLSMDVTDLDSISFEEPGELSIEPETKLLDSNGGRFILNIVANKSWTATVNDPTALTVSKSSGSGSENISVLAQPNAEAESYSAILTVTLSNGQYKQLVVTVQGKSEPEPEPLAEKCNASDYAQVTIGTQTWMAENYRCSKYDTESEAYNASWITNNTIPTSGSAAYTPYYTDATDKTKWYSSEYAGNLTNEQIDKLGYLYNWAAAVGVENGYDYGRTPFTGNRQGICPNGWHIPTRGEWQTLYNYIYNDQQLSGNTVGKYLKTTSGWYNNGNGTDRYGFEALPSGEANGSSVHYVGYFATFWPATPDGGNSDLAYYRRLYYGDDYLYDSYYGKGGGRSVRCLKTEESQIETISVNPTYYHSEYIGGYFTIGVSSNAEYTYSVDKNWVQLDGFSDSIAVTIQENSTVYSDTAYITVTTMQGKTATVLIERDGKTQSLAERCSASDYAQVTIGTQTWMAENYRCSKYDTESEAYNASWLTNNTVLTSSSVVYTPYYTDVTDKTKWSSTQYAGNLSNEQIAKLGYLYNWAAAVGVEDGYNQTSAFTGNRQGICPNGWHVPSKAEWQTLANYIDGNNGYTDTGKKIKTTSSWYENGNGTDSYGFSALPSGYATGSSVNIVGNAADIWTATPDGSNSQNAYYRNLCYCNNYLLDFNDLRSHGRSVRCIKNSSEPEPEPEPDPDPDPTPETSATYYIIGNGSEETGWCCGTYWGNGCLMEDGKYSVIVPAGTYQFYIFGETSLGYSDVNAETSTAGYMEASRDNVKFTVPSEATINVSVDSSQITLTSSVPFSDLITQSWTVAGYPEILGSEWDPSDTSNDMQLVGDTYKLEKKGLVLEAGVYEYKMTADHNWCIKECPESGNYSFEIEEAGTYNITFTLDAQGTEGNVIVELVTESNPDPNSDPEPESKDYTNKYCDEVITAVDGTTQVSVSIYNNNGTYIVKFEDADGRFDVNPISQGIFFSSDDGNKLLLNYVTESNASTIICEIDDVTPDKIFTPIYLLMSGEKQFTALTNQEIDWDATCSGGGECNLTENPTMTSAELEGEAEATQVVLKVAGEDENADPIETYIVKSSSFADRQIKAVKIDDPEDPSIMNYFITLSNLDTETDYTVTVFAVDTCNNVSEDGLDISFKTAAMVSECEGQRGHVATPDMKKINFKLESGVPSAGRVTATITSIEAGATFSFAEIQMPDGMGMNISPDGSKATIEFDDVTAPTAIRFLYNTTAFVGNEMTCEPLALNAPYVIVYTPNGCPTTPSDADESEPEQTTETFTDICGNTYPVVTIGTQTWLKENMKCDKYDTKSEAYNAAWLTNNTIPTSESNVYTPYYIDVTDKSNWDNMSKIQYGVNLTETQIAKLGYLYNWTAAVGIENGLDYDTTPFTGNRQGICPNGWHVPSEAEWQTLYDYIYNAQGLLSNAVGKYLKTTSGWYDSENGTDSYGFAAFPSGYTNSYGGYYVGDEAHFWTATPDNYNSDMAYYKLITSNADGLSDYPNVRKYGQSVRCLKD